MDLSPLSPTRVRLLGAEIDIATADDVMRFTARRIRQGQKGLIANHNAHSLALLKTQSSMRAFYDRADLIEIDSTPMIAWAKLMGLPVGREHRCTYLDWREAFWTMAQSLGWRVFYLGCAPGIADAAAAKIRQEWPDVELATHHGYFDHAPGSTQNQAVVAQINAFAPDVVFVGMGMPVQESWIEQNFESLTQGVVFSVGGAFDYEAGVQSACPRWLGRIGLEWLYRFATQPKRLFVRYFVEPWSLAPAAIEDLREMLGRRTAEAPELTSGKVEVLLATLSERRARPL
jgi:N-acetylglucosaminyldiphosphoundecaprenol N-acetyl-beta-D-mannosaminyltransferase